MRWALEALREHTAAAAFLRERRVASVHDMLDDIDAAIGQLANRNTGRPGRVPGTFEKSLPRWRYIIAYEYRTASDGVEELYILHLIHTSRNWPTGEWPR